MFKPAVIRVGRGLISRSVLCARVWMARAKRALNLPGVLRLCALTLVRRTRHGQLASASTTASAAASPPRPPPPPPPPRSSLIRLASMPPCTIRRIRTGRTGRTATVLTTVTEVREAWRPCHSKWVRARVWRRKLVLTCKSLLRTCSSTPLHEQPCTHVRLTLPIRSSCDRR